MLVTLIVNVVILGFGGMIWKKGDFLNAFIKFGLICLAVVNAYYAWNLLP